MATDYFSLAKSLAVVHAEEVGCTASVDPPMDSYSEARFTCVGPKECEQCGRCEMHCETKGCR